MSLREALAALRSGLDRLPLELWVREVGGRCVYANRAAIDRWPWLVDAGLDAPEANDELATVWRDGHERAMSGEVFEARLAEDDGDGPRFVASPIRGDEAIVGTVAFLVAGVDDPAERRAVDRARRLAALCHRAPALIGIRQIDGATIRHLYDNACAAALFDRPPEALVGVSEDELGVSARMIARALARFRASRHGAAPFEITVPAKGGDRVLSGTVEPIDWPGADDAYAVVARDVTDRRALEAGILRMDRLGALATIVETLGHELANPALYALLSLERLEDNLDDWVRREARDEVQDIVQTATHGVRELLAVADDVRSLVGREERDEEEVAIDHVVEAVNHLVAARDRTVLALDDPPPVLGHRVQLAQLVLNLVRNALEASAETGGKVRVRTRHDDGEVVLEVEDEGPGVPEDMTDEELFGAFVTTKGEQRGTGLGLYLCRHIAESHRGTIRHERPDGGGARFVVRLPCA